MALPQLEQPPPYPHNLDDLKLPSLPAGGFRKITSPQLPTLEPLLSLSAITNGLDGPHNSRSERDTLYKTLSNQVRANIAPLQLPRIHGMDPAELTSPIEMGSVSSLDDHRRRGTSVLMQDADDRMAAEALCGLGKVGP